MAGADAVFGTDANACAALLVGTDPGICADVVCDDAMVGADPMTSADAIASADLVAFAGPISGADCRVRGRCRSQCCRWATARRSTQAGARTSTTTLCKHDYR